MGRVVVSTPAEARRTASVAVGQILTAGKPVHWALRSCPRPRIRRVQWSDGAPERRRQCVVPVGFADPVETVERRPSLCEAAVGDRADIGARRVVWLRASLRTRGQTSRREHAPK